MFTWNRPLWNGRLALLAMDRRFEQRRTHSTPNQQILVRLHYGLTRLRKASNKLKIYHRSAFDPVGFQIYTEPEPHMGGNCKLIYSTLVLRRLHGSGCVAVRIDYFAVQLQLHSSKEQ